MQQQKQNKNKFSTHTFTYGQREEMKSKTGSSQLSLSRFSGLLLSIAIVCAQKVVTQFIYI